MKLAIVSTHPIQYNAPMFRRLASSHVVQIKIFYTLGAKGLKNNFDPGFGKNVEWDIPLLDGYDYTFVENVAADPGWHHFNGIDNPGLIDEIRRWEADSILVYGWNHKSHLAVMRHFKGKIPVYFRGDSTLLDESGMLRTIMRRIFLRWVYSHVDKAYYVGTNNKNYFLAHGLRENQLVFAPHAIDNDRFRNLSGEQQQRVSRWREELGFAPSDLVLMFVGKFDPKKQPETLLRIAKGITDRRVRFLFVGNGIEEQSLKQQALNDDRIKFLDFQNQSKMPLVYHLGDILVLPSKSETWGLAINEAMACGLPVIASDKCGGAIDLITTENGLIFPHNDHTPVVHFLNKCLARPELLKKMGQASAKRIEKFSFAAIAAAIEGTVSI